MAVILLLGIAHGLSDAAAGFAVGVLLQMNVSEGGLLVFLYNGLAFGLQPIAGLMLDRVWRPREGAASGLILTSIGLATFWWNPRLGIVLIGLGSVFFHAGAGAMAILNSPGRASGPGLFASFGVIGLVIGTRLSFGEGVAMTLYFAMALAVLAIVVSTTRSTVLVSGASFDVFSGLKIPVILIVAAFALRSLVWTGVDRAVDSAADLAVFIGFSAGIGKLAGGFLADRIGWARWTRFALTASAVLLVFACDAVIALLLGIFLLQSVTGLTISWLGRALPETPALAASLALGAAVVIGGLPFAFTSGSWFGAGAILISLALSVICYKLGLQHKAGQTALAN